MITLLLAVWLDLMSLRATCQSVHQQDSLKFSLMLLLQRYM